MTDKPKRKKKAAPPPEELVLPDVMPVIPSGTNVLYPQQLMPIMAVEERDRRAIDEAASSEGKLVAIFSEQGDDEGSKGGVRLRDVGTVAGIVRMAKAPDGSVHAILQGRARIRLVAVEGEGPPVRARVEALDDQGGAGLKAEAIMREASEAFVRAATLSDAMPSEVAAAISDISEPAALADFIAANLPLKPEDRYQVLAELDVGRRLALVSSLLKHELEVLEVRSKIQSDVKGELDKRQRDFILREQQIPSVSPEYQVVRTYLEWIADLPWNITTDDQLDIEHAARILDEDHYGLEKVKTRILDFLAVLNLKGGETRGPILCFVGPPGTGKTSLGQSIARALNRNFIRVSLGGMRDEAEIRGHRRTYVGAMPGRIIQELRRAASANPLMMLDEVDKLGTDFRGDPAAALLEVLDPAQNFTFTDHYLDIAFDLSRVFFIATANLTDSIPSPLLDRMEVIELPGYTEYEKLEIGRRYLLPRQLEENGISKAALRMSEGAIREVIRSYTREAGVRNLERELGSVCRRVARLVVEGEKGQTSVTQDNVSDFLGPARFRWELAARKDEVGVAAGLAATAAGGDVLFVEATAVPGKGRLTLTGKLGDVMQESAQAALTYARSRADKLGIAPAFFERNDLHIHVPAGAVPKDGPSAGVTMATALVSVMTRRPIHKDVAMTGEITLRGKVLPVGAIRDKILAAHRAGIKRIIMPRDNENDLLDVREEVRRDLEFVLVDSVDDVLNAALHEEALDDGPGAEQLAAGS